MATQVQLTPSQRVAADGLIKGIFKGGVLILESRAGMGRTTVLQHVHAALGGSFVGIRRLMTALMHRGPAAMEEAFLETVEQAFEGSDLVIIDDLHLVNSVADGCSYPRSWLLDAVLTALMDQAALQGKKLILGGVDHGRPMSVHRRGQVWEIADFKPDDYQIICSAYLPAETAARLEYARIHRFAPLLNIWQLKNACASLSGITHLQTDALIEYLKEHNITSNVEIEDVRQVDWKSLKGLDDVIQALETKIALPFENHILSAKLNLKPRRGVLLAGPPGTGKTTIGRALAHRLKGKFFLIDGTAISGTNDFYEIVRKVFEAATRNAPSVIFIDDTDVIFEGDHDRGLYRYLLTRLDGLESAKADRVCVMMTAMDPRTLPAALLRSGRIELWLETKLPDIQARISILRDKLTPLPPPLALVDVFVIGAATHGLTGADLETVIEDGKLLFADDIVKGNPLRSVEKYFLEAIATVRANRRNYKKRKPTVLDGSSARIGFELPETAA